MFKSLSTSLIAQGILALAVGVIALAWPSVTVLALVILFAVYAFIAAGMQAVRAFSSAKAGPVFGHLLLGLADLAAGVIALAWPGPTALVLVLIVGVWAVIADFVECFAAFALRSAFEPEARTMLPEPARIPGIAGPARRRVADEVNGRPDCGDGHATAPQSGNQQSPGTERPGETAGQSGGSGI